MFPHLVTATNVPNLIKIEDVNWDQVDAAFCCLPHATTQVVIKGLPKSVKVVDLSADFRLKDPKVSCGGWGLSDDCARCWMHFAAAEGPSV